MSDWLPIEQAPKDGTPVVAAKRSTMWGGFPYPLTSRFLDGVWKADFGQGDWASYDPQPTHYLAGSERRALSDAAEGGQ